MSKPARKNGQLLTGRSTAIVGRGDSTESDDTQARIEQLEAEAANLRADVEQLTTSFIQYVNVSRVTDDQMMAFVAQLRRGLRKGGRP